MKRRIKIFVLAQVALLAFGLFPFVWLPVQAQQTERAKSLGKRLICMCGCNQILTACNHVGCTTSTTMLKKLDQVVARNEPDDLTLQSFVQEYGVRVLAEPPAKGFSRLAWWIPGFALAIGLIIVLVVISRWRNRGMRLATGPNVPADNWMFTRRKMDWDTEDDNESE